MSPPAPGSHGSHHSEISHLLRSFLSLGRTITECPISTSDGVKIADVGGHSSPRFLKVRGEACDSPAPGSALRFFPLRIPNRRSPKKRPCTSRRVPARSGSARPREKSLSSSPSTLPRLRLHGLARNSPGRFPPIERNPKFAPPQNPGDFHCHSGQTPYRLPPRLWWPDTESDLPVFSLTARDN